MSLCEDSGPLALNRQLCFALYAASRAVTRAYQPMLQDLGITYPQYLVLLVLWERDTEEDGDAGTSVGALGERLMLDSGTLTPLLKRMEQRGLVSRERAPWDERVTVVAITDDGRALEPRARVWVERELDGSEVTREEVEQLRQNLWQLLDKLGASAG
ncbi:MULTISPECIES: MarR family transcriptional regulator [unclassified Microbulbifer]|uniref:MarR family winged helix-turn-helix transcriptional regulator n=1 Tax=unclassified Microbulbifer TaxID=2619833 RepID=UPI0027E5033A|nr:MULTISPECIES: MarR family transcriptional regulator [unclassified Microbulbifer]